MTKHKNKQGFTLIEALGAFLMVVIALGLGMTGYIYTLKNTNESDIQSELDINVQQAMERLKSDLRLSSLDQIFYYPAGAGPYTAMSFPLAEDDDDDGLFELDADGFIIWNKTVVYHVWPSSPHQLRVTTFKNRNNDLSDTFRQYQLDKVVETGGGTAFGIPNNDNASSAVLFENLLEWSLRPKQGIYDAYSPINERERVSLGFALLDAGDHQFTFKAAGKNSMATGYDIGIDQLVVSPSYSDREAEAQLPAASQSGAAAVSQYMTAGSWQGNHQLYFPAASPGASFTLSMNNDRWEETNFKDENCVEEDTTVEFDETLSPRDFIAQLDGMDVTWSAADQTGDLVGTNSTGNLKNMAVRIMQKGADITDNGNWLAYNGKQCQLTFAASSLETFRIRNIWIGESSSSTDAAMDYMNTIDAPMKPVTFNNGATVVEIPIGQKRTSDWIDLPIDRNKNYLVSFRIANNVAKDGPKQWTDYEATDPAFPSPLTTMIVENASYDVAQNPSWSSISGLPVYATNRVFGLESITASYPETGTFTSQIFDTHLAAPSYGEMSWNADLPYGTGLEFKVRTGNSPDLVDAPDWSAITPFSSARTLTVDSKRYIQFQALMQTNTGDLNTPKIDGTFTPKLQDVTIDWTGELQLVNIGGTFTKGPGYGVVEVLVDGVPLQSALTVDLMIYKDIRSIKGEKKRITSSLLADIRPRNTGK
ncbi:PulJ/GspJ family protein [Pontiella sulfatireligans]|uniref:Uncharacterized protein n=1 Tax=Pontiella sulfatireligans TaxID=2750658 RepID=A0A6C2UI75_9BACT|nr:hypothetical protein [Pontiella sulfatireligans]VGO19157.1 hypothetical protein SCARR_01214 [Pontiella sulfatireligans]